VRKFYRDRRSGDTAHRIADFQLRGSIAIAGVGHCSAAAPALRRRLFATFRAEFEKALERMDRRTNELLERLAGLSEAKGEALPAA
jgi:hypothetical protein